ncbi:MAG: hypothetical protein WBC33_07835 [Conexibacter sp.]
MAPPPNLDELLETVNYPGMIPEESRVLRSWMAKHGAAYDELRFNERVGPGVMLGDHVPEKDRRDWESRTKARPDVIAIRHPLDALVVEAKWQATNETIWQVLSYVELYASSFPDWKVRAAIVATDATPAARVLASRMGVTVFLYTLNPNAPLAPGEETPAPAAP